MNNLNQVASETRGGTTRTNSWNPNGNLAGDGDRTYSWTFGNRMSGATGGGQTASYTYDSEDRRAAKTVNGVMTRTLWSGSEEIAQMNAAGTLTRYIIPDGSGVMDARLAILEVSGSQVTWLHTDHQGSVVATTNSTGVMTGRYVYSPYGELTRLVILTEIVRFENRSGRSRTCKPFDEPARSALASAAGLCDNALKARLLGRNADGHAFAATLARHRHRGLVRAYRCFGRLCGVGRLHA